MSNLASFSYHTQGGFRPVYKRESRTKHEGTVIDIGPITIERVITATGKEGYRVIGRERKIFYSDKINMIIRALEKEAYRLGTLRNPHKQDPETRRKQALESYHRNKTAINERRRKRRAELKALR